MDHYLTSLNATKAACEAGYSAKTAHTIGWNLLQNVDVQAEISKAMEERSARIRKTQDDVLIALWEEATRMGEGCSHSARVRALELFGKHLGMFRDEVNVSLFAGMSLDQLHEEARRRGIDPLRRPALGAVSADDDPSDA